VFADAKFGVEFKVPEFLFADEVVGLGSVGEDAVLDGPAEVAIGEEGLPAGHILTVEEGDGFAFLPRAVVLFIDDWGADASPGDGAGFAVILDGAIDEFAVGEAGAEDDVAAVAGAEAEGDAVALDFEFVNDVEVAGVGGDELAFGGGGAGAFDFKPPGAAAGFVFGGDIPTAVEGGIGE
jgi:hypothetical protein